MVERLICEGCDTGRLLIRPDEAKEEENYCAYCPADGTRAECLFQGKPACVNCKINKKSQTKSPAGSIRSERVEPPQTNWLAQLKNKKDSRTGSADGSLSPGRSRTSGAQLHATMITAALDRALHSRNSSQVSSEFLKANAFLLKYVGKQKQELVPLYDSIQDGLSAHAFHSKCDDSKDGIIVILSLAPGYEVAGFSWKGIRKGCPENSDVQAGGAIIRHSHFEFVVFSDNFVINEPEGIRFSRKSDLYVNFDQLTSSVCNFDKKLANNPLWTDWISSIKVYKLQV